MNTILLIPPTGSTLLDDPCAPVMVEWCCKTGGCGRVWWLPFRPDTLVGCPSCGRGIESVRGTFRRAIVLATDGKVQRHGCLTLADASEVAVVRPRRHSPGSVRRFAMVLLQVGFALCGDPAELRTFTEVYLCFTPVLVLLDAEGKVLP